MYVGVSNEGGEDEESKELLMVVKKIMEVKEIKENLVCDGGWSEVDEGRKVLKCCESERRAADEWLTNGWRTTVATFLSYRRREEWDVLRSWNDKTIMKPMLNTGCPRKSDD